MILTEEESLVASPLVSKQDKNLKTLIEIIEKLKLEKELLYKQIQKKENEIKRLEEELNKKIVSQEDASSSNRRNESLYNALSTISSRLREVEEELQAEKAIKSFFLDTIREIALNRKTIIPNCNTITKGVLEGNLKDTKVNYCYVDNLADLNPSVLTEVGIKSVFVIEKCIENLKDSFLEEGIGVLCNAKNHYNCEVINNEVLICDPKVAIALDKEAEHAREVKLEKERTKILKLLIDYKESSRKKEAT